VQDGRNAEHYNPKKEHELNRSIAAIRGEVEDPLDEVQSSLPQEIAENVSLATPAVNQGARGYVHRSHRYQHAGQIWISFQARPTKCGESGNPVLS
jgi:hypothetical protein